MKKSELDKLNYEIDGVVYTPIYVADEWIPILDENNKVIDFELVGFQLIQSAEDYYLNKDNPIEKPIDKMEVLKARVDGLENINAGLLLENAGHQIKIQEQEKMNKEQEVTNANLLLEIAMLKGAML